MKTSENINLRFANTKDFKNIASLRAGEREDASSTEDYISHWYECNPNGSYSLAICSLNEEVAGVASTNNFKFKIAGKQKLVAMPQKVLTSNKVRGRGVFGQLYRMTEADNLEKGVDCFLTFTNSMSTPIFLEKFNYIKGQSPEIYLLFSNPIRMCGFSKPYKSVLKFNENYWNEHQPLQSDNAMLKTPEYYKWRYQSYKKELYIKLEVKYLNKLLGYTVLKKIHKKGLPFHVVSDIITHTPENIKDLICVALTYATRRLSLGIMICHHELFTEVAYEFLKIKFTDRLNLLVKGKTEEDTKTLSEIKFNFSFGDFDFI